ncbi:MAG: hypothetical protein ACRDPC_28705 [Solirubrobacteraceae bacterium]
MLILQDGLRYFADGVATGVPRPPDVPGEELDTEDQGQKAFNYRSARLDALLRTAPADPVTRARSLAIEPPTPVFEVPAGADVTLHLVVAADKPRNHSFTLHGHPVGTEGALTTGTVRTYAFRAAAEPGDYAYRSGVYKWAIAQGLWGLLRVMG